MATGVNRPKGFSSQSYSPASSRGSPSIPPTNKQLLNPLNTKVDPVDQEAKTKEKDQMVGLNDKFVALIDKVRNLEQQNKALETRLKILLEQENYKGNIDDIVSQLAANLRKQIDSLARDRQKLENELNKSQDDVENTRAKYEDELQKKAEAENDFVLTKKDVDEGYLQRVGLELKLEDLLSELDFLRKGYDEEIKELESLIQNETVVLKSDGARDLDMDEILKGVQAQYETMATRSREEAEHWNRKKMDDMVLKAGKHEQDVRDIKKEIADIQRNIQRLRNEIDALKRKKESLEGDIKNAEENGQRAIDEAREQIAQLEEALRRDKQVMAHQVREYQVLMNLKLALDIEIATYRKLLEGEEMRMAEQQRNQYDVKDQGTQSQEPPPVTNPDTPKRSLLIKIEVKNGRVISESSQFL
ncbi:intermediate filament protein ON3-like [Chanos chanos]|uniref:Keratin, type II cytoskeletal 8 n=1 Tax=Chanos chanos TaxID=29144 RepID=A0A6J2W1P8_CHACN|nr:intermediate filament protein ON3-like [Chanos chanos]